MSSQRRRPGPAEHPRPRDADPALGNDADPAIRTVGVIGTGRIGLPIAGHLVRRGFDVLAYDVDGTRRHLVEQRGARWVTAADLVRDSEATLICVGYDRELRALWADGLLAHAPRGAVVAVLSTVHPRTVQELAALAAPAGIALVDATMCRGGRAADAGTLLSFVAGARDVVDRLRPVIAAYSTDIVYTGAIGTAQAAKAANNLLMWACLIANHEALALAQRFGVDVGLLREALLKTGADNGVLRNWGTSTMAWADDDLQIIQEMARQAGIALPQADLSRELCRAVKPKKFRLDEYGT